MIFSLVLVFVLTTNSQQDKDMCLFLKHFETAGNPRTMFVTLVAFCV